MRSARGQGTVEYLAVVLLVAVVLGGTATVASGAAGDIATAVPREVIRGICIVRGGDCYRDIAPCDVASSSKSRKWALTIAVITFGHDKTVTKTRRSDGRYAVTLDTAPRGGLALTNGVRAVVKRGKRSFAAGSVLSAEITGSYAHQRTWILSNEDAAQRLIDTIAAGDGLPPADLDGHMGSVRVGADVSKTAGRLDVSGSVLAGLDLSSQTERATGRTTYALGEALDGTARAALTGMSTAAATSAGVSARVALTVAPDGRWLDLAVTTTGQFSRRADLPPFVAPIADRLGASTKAGREWVAESHLDLTNPDNFAAVQGLVARLKDPLHPAAAARAVDAVAGRIRADAVIDVRSYALDSEPNVIDVQAGDTLKVGGRYDTSSENTRLVAARTRRIDGHWHSREECVQEART